MGTRKPTKRTVLRSGATQHRAKGSGSIREREPGVWQLAYETATGGKRRRRYATVRGTRKQAESKLRDLLGAVDRGEHVDRSKITTGQWLNEWLEQRRGHIAAKTLERYKETIERQVAPHIERIRLQLLSVTDVQSAVNHLRDAGRLRRAGNQPAGLSPKMVRHALVLLRTALRDAVI